MFYAQHVAAIGQRMASDRIADLQQSAQQCRGTGAGVSRAAGRQLRVPATNLTRSAIRLAGGVAITLALLLSAGVASGAPLEFGLFECGPGECATANYAAETPQRTGGPFGPHLVP